jgi:hypothetical protein
VGKTAVAIAFGEAERVELLSLARSPLRGWERFASVDSILRRPLKIRIIASLAFLAASSIEVRSAPANTLSDLWRELSACVKAPGDSAGSELTIIFALKRDGSLLGKPRITHSHLLGNADAQNAFVAGAVEALAKCLPASIKDDLGGAIAGRPLSIRIGRLPKETDT